MEWPAGFGIEETCRFLSDPALDGRYPGSEGHRIAREYLESVMARLGFEPLLESGYVQEVAVDGFDTVGENLVGIKRGRGERVILLGAHYDHFKGIPGADDNAAALSILIDAVNRLGPWRGEHHLVLCFFDQEEPPYFHSDAMGSTYFTRHAPFELEKLDCAIVLDLCGHDVPLSGCEEALFVLGAEYSAQLVEVAEACGNRELPAYLFRNERIGDMSDHHGFRLAGCPFLFLSCGWWEHYHVATDTFDRLNLEKMGRISGYVRRLVEELDGREVVVSSVEEFWRKEAESLRGLTGYPIPDDEQIVDEAVSLAIEQMTHGFMGGGG